MNSKHYRRDRQAREAVIEQIGMGMVIKSVRVDRGHRNGPEIHKITSTALVLVYNERTGILVTKLIARPAQITRYFGQNEVVPTEVLNLARQHARNGWNEL
jgi:hypothetical protein